jgi:Flp pilus assembly protein TadG
MIRMTNFFKTPAMPRRFSDRRGQTLVEFSLSAFMLIMLLMGVVEICRIILVYTTIANASRAGVRYAIVHGTHNPPTTSVTNVVNSYLGVGSVNTGTVTVNVEYLGAPGCTGLGCIAGCTNPGCAVTVTVNYPYNPLFSYFPITTLHLASKSQGVITF